MIPFYNLKFYLQQGTSMPLTEPDLWFSHIRLFSIIHKTFFTMYKSCVRFSESVFVRVSRASEGTGFTLERAVEQVDKGKDYGKDEGI